MGQMVAPLGFEPKMTESESVALPLGYGAINKKLGVTQFILQMVTRTGFEPVNAAVKGQCVKPLHQRAIMVGLGGLEPPTSRLSGVRSNQLSYKPIIKWTT